MLSTSLKNSTNGVLNSHVYGYNLASQRTVLTNTLGDYRNYTYDGIGQLTSANGFEANGASRLQEQLAYVYDPSGNLNWRTNNGFWEYFAVNDLNEISTVTRGTANLTVAGTTTSPATNVTVNGSVANRYNDNTFALGGFALVNGTNMFTAIAADSYGRQDTNSISVNLPTTSTFSYDQNGNLLSDGSRIFKYDDENQLISVVVTNTPGVSIRSDFVYDGKMRRRIRREYSWVTSDSKLTSEIRYVYDDKVVVQERNANNIPSISYTRGMDLGGGLQSAGGIGGLLAGTDNSLSLLGRDNAHMFYQADANGNVSVLLNFQQDVVARYTYDPFGDILNRSGLAAQENGCVFSSKDGSTTSGLLYFGNRFYDPNLQRWVTRDPILEYGGLNLYRFADNDPINAVDPFGFDTQGSTVVLIPKLHSIDTDNGAERGMRKSVMASAVKEGYEVISVSSVPDANRKLKRCKNCISTLNVEGHGNGAGMWIGSDRQPDNTLKVTPNGNNGWAFQNVDAMFGGINFCPQCTIYLRGCSLTIQQGWSVLKQKIESITKCTVVAFASDCHPGKDHGLSAP